MNADATGANEARPDGSELKVRWLGYGAGLLVGLATFAVGVSAMHSYRAGLFVAAPFMMGAMTGWFVARRVPLRASAAAGLGVKLMFLSALALLCFALEGALCVLMALPLAMPLAALGAVAGQFLAQRGLTWRGTALGLLLLPLGTAGEALQRGGAPSDASHGASLDLPLRVVTTCVDIDAPPAVVWERVLAFPELAPPSSWLFRHGIAYPVRARIDGAGPGAVRRCEFSTGAFVEPITAWEAPTRLAFDVTSQPVPMTEWNPWGPIDAPHLHGTLRAHRGEFRLVPLPGDRTRLEGRTWYTLDMAPLAYWSLWSDTLIHDIHGRVLEHIAALAEADARAR